MPTKPPTNAELVALCRENWAKLSARDQAAIEHVESQMAKGLPPEHKWMFGFSQAVQNARKASG